MKELHEIPPKQAKHVYIPCSMSLVYTLCLNRAMLELFHYIFCLSFAFEENLRRFGFGGQAFLLHELKYSRGLELRMGHYTIFINLTSLHAREIDGTTRWGVRHFGDVPCYR